MYRYIAISIIIATFAISLITIKRPVYVGEETRNNDFRDEPYAQMTKTQEEEAANIGRSTKPIVTVYLKGKVPFIITLEDVKHMSDMELEKYGTYLILCQGYGWGDDSSEFVEKMTYQYLPQWILERISNAVPLEGTDKYSNEYPGHDSMPSKSTGQENTALGGK